jgi:hypothetical protein
MRRLHADRGDNPDPGTGPKISLTSNARLDNEVNFFRNRAHWHRAASGRVYRRERRWSGVRLRKRQQNEKASAVGGLPQPKEFSRWSQQAALVFDFLTC